MIKEHPITTVMYGILVVIVSWYIGTLDFKPYQAGIVSGITAIIIGIPFIFYWTRKSGGKKR